MFGRALDRAVTACVRSWKIIGLFFLALAVNQAIGNLAIRLTIEFVLLTAWTPAAASIALRSVGVEVPLSARTTGRYIITLFAWYAVIAPLLIGAVAAWYVAAPALRNQVLPSSIVVLAMFAVVLFACSRLAIAPLVSMLGALPTNAAFRESLALTKGRFVFSGMVVAIGWIGCVLPSYMIYDAALEVFKAPVLYLADVPLANQLWIARVVAEPFSLYSTVAINVIQAQLIDWLRGAGPNVRAEGLV